VKIKLDENFGSRCADLLRRYDHPVATVPDQAMQGFADRTLIETCRSEQRCLVTLDLDFANPLLFRPSHHSGIAVVRTPSPCKYDDLVAAIDLFARHLRSNTISGKLWIIERHRVREYQEER
jgi:predicted nuclease of predicted toxin-antitoxin system